MSDRDTASGTGPPSPGSADRMDRLVVLGAIFVLGLVLRLVFLAQIAGTPFGDELFLDSLLYSAAAERLLGGEAIAATAYFVDPLYTYFLAAIYLLTGGSVLAVRLVQAVIGAASAVLAAWLGEELSGDRRVGVLSGVGVATYGLLIFHDLQLLKTPLEVFLGLAAMAALLAARRRGSPPLHLLAGGVLGLAILVHGSYLLLPPAIACWMVLESRPGARRAGLRPAAAFLLGTVLLLVPVTARNIAVSGQFVLTTYNAGMNFYEGNNPESDGAYRRPSFIRADPLEEESDSRREAERRAGRELGPAEISSFWFGEAFGWIATHPGDWLRLTGRKLLLFWNHYEIDDNVSFYFTRQFIRFLAWPLPGFRVWGPLGLAGMVLLLPRLRRFAPAYLFVGIQTAAVVGFHVIDRYRLPVVPFLVIFGAAAAVGIWDALRDGRLRRAGAALAVVTAAAALVNLPQFYRAEETFSRPYYALGKFYFERGEPAPAERFCRSSLEVDPEYAPPHAVLGKILLASGRTEEALLHFRQSTRLDPGYADSFYGEGIALLRLGRLKEAAERFRALRDADPAGPAAVWLGDVALARGSLEEAAGWFRDALAAGTAPTQSSHGLARALHLLGDDAGARAALEALPPEVRDPELAGILGLAGPPPAAP